MCNDACLGQSHDEGHARCTVSCMNSVKIAMAAAAGLASAAFLAAPAMATPYMGDSQARTAASSISLYLQADSAFTQKPVKVGYVISPMALGDLKGAIPRGAVVRGLKNGKITAKTVTVKVDGYACSITFAASAGMPNPVTCKKA